MDSHLPATFLTVVTDVFAFFKEIIHCTVNCLTGTDVLSLARAFRHYLGAQ